MITPASVMLAALFNATLAFSFSSLYFKGGNHSKIWKPVALYTLFNLLLGAAGFGIGFAIAPRLDILAPVAGALLMIVLAIKLGIRGLKTKTISRVFDIEQLPTMIGLLFVLNIDTLLAAVALALMNPPITALWIPALVITASVGLVAGMILGKQSKFILPNLLDILAAITLLGISIPQLLQ
jgi:putative Mn2+ efflux pump MntP